MSIAAPTVKKQNMKELFIPYELSLLAKEYGFDEPCFARYIRKEFRFATLGGMTNFTKEQPPNQLSAPLYQQLIDWFREKHNLEVCSLKEKENVYFGFIDGGISRKQVSQGKSYYEALNKAFEEVFKLVELV